MTHRSAETGAAPVVRSCEATLELYLKHEPDSDGGYRSPLARLRGVDRDGRARPELAGKSDKRRSDGAYVSRSPGTPEHRWA